jgi:hypothetical protein
MPRFDVARWRWRVGLDRGLRVGAGLLLLAVFLALLIGGFGGSTASVLAAVLLVVVWIGMNAAGAGAMRALPTLTAAIEADPDAAEPGLVKLWSLRLLPRWVRLSLTHRWAMLRHRQQKFAEAAAIAQTLLRAPASGPAHAHRPHLLLLLAESRLELRDPVGAWLALVELHRTPLGLGEALQRMALRVRYELMTGQHDAALTQLDEKVRLAELMPAGPCGALHAMLATAAHRHGDTPRYESLWARVELLCSPEQIAQMRESHLAI